MEGCPYLDAGYSDEMRDLGHGSYRHAVVSTAGGKGTSMFACTASKIVNGKIPKLGVMKVRGMAWSCVFCVLITSIKGWMTRC